MGNLDDPAVLLPLIFTGLMFLAMLLYQSWPRSVVRASRRTGQRDISTNLLGSSKTFVMHPCVCLSMGAPKREEIANAPPRCRHVGLLARCLCIAAPIGATKLHDALPVRDPGVSEPWPRGQLLTRRFPASTSPRKGARYRGGAKAKGATVLVCGDSGPGRRIPLHVVTGVTDDMHVVNTLAGYLALVAVPTLSYVTVLSHMARKGAPQGSPTQGGVAPPPAHQSAGAA